MRKIKFSSIIIIVSILLSSCSYHSGYMNNSVSLNQANFKYNYQSVSGSASTVLFLGIGGFNTDKIVDDAKKDLLRNHPLKSNQALANITVNWRNSFYIIVMSTTCTVSADIVEFTSENKEIIGIEKNIDIVQDAMLLSTEFIIGTTWVNKKPSQELVFDFKKNGKAMLTDIRYDENNTIIRESKIKYSYIYSNRTIKLTDVNNLSSNLTINESNLIYNDRLFILQ